MLYTFIMNINSQMILIFFRDHEASLKKLRKLLSDSSKNMRHRRFLINIHIAFLGWLIEFSGFFLVILGSFILGHGSAHVTLILQTITFFIYFNILPCIYLINDEDLKSSIAESSHYFNFLKFFNCEKVNPRYLRKSNESSVFDNQSENNNS